MRRAAREKARLELRLARAQLAASEAAVAGTTVANHPAVKQAEARLREAWLALSRCEIRAPEDGYVAKRSVQVGQQVHAGTALMAIVPLSQVWVEANFKEDQLQGHDASASRCAGLRPLWQRRDIPRQGGGTCRREPAACSPCCRRRTPAATGSRSSSACRCVSRWIPRS